MSRRIESLHIDVTSARIARVAVREWVDPTSPPIHEEITRAVVASAVDRRGRRTMMVQFEQITPTNWQNTIAFRPGMGWRGGRQDVSLHDVYIPFDGLNLGAVDQTTTGRWIPAQEVGRILD